MKVKAPSLLKKIIEALSSKTNDLRIRMMIFFLLHKNLDKSSLTNSLHALVSHHKKKKNDDVLQEEEEEEESQGHSLMMNYKKATSMHAMVNNTIHDDEKSNVVDDNMSREHHVYNHDDIDVHDDAHDDIDVHDDDDDDDEKHPRVDLSDLSFQESKVEMEDREDIDQAADLFIQRFRKQIILQKQRSLERQNWLLLSNA